MDDAYKTVMKNQTSINKMNSNSFDAISKYLEVNKVIVVFLLIWNLTLTLAVAVLYFKG